MILGVMITLCFVLAGLNLWVSYTVLGKVKEKQRVVIELPPDLLIRQDTPAKAAPDMERHRNTTQTLYLFDKHGKLKHEVSMHDEVPGFHSYGGRSYRHIDPPQLLTAHLHPVTATDHEFQEIV